MAKVLCFAKLIKDEDLSNEPQQILPLDSKNEKDDKQENVFVSDKPLYFIKRELKGQLQTYDCAFHKTKSFRHLFAFSNGVKVDQVELHQIFKAYKKESSDVVYFDTKTENGIDFVKRINSYTRKNSKKTGDFFEEVEIDFERIVTRCSQVKGCWVNVSGINVTAKSIHGHDMKSSDDFLELTNEGEVSSLIILYEYSGLELRIQISKKGSIYLIDKLGDLDEREVLMHITEKLITNNM